MSPAVRPTSVAAYFLPVDMRVPLKFGSEVTSYVTCLRVSMTVTDADGRAARGWGETPLSVTWAWASKIGYEERHQAMKQFCLMLGVAWADFDHCGHPLEIGHAFIQTELPRLLQQLNAERAGPEPMPWLAALICCSAFDIALHDAYGHAVDQPIYQTYNADFMQHDLSHYLTPAPGSNVSFQGRYPADFFTTQPPHRMPAWHLVGGTDLLTSDERTGTEPDDGYPVELTQWIERDGLNCLKVKLRGNDAPWDYQRLVKVGQIAINQNTDWLTADFNCTVTNPAYVNDILDRLVIEHPRIAQMILYVEQPFPYDLEANQIDVHSVSARKPLFMDESAHDWELIRLGRTLGWTGVALKTCKTQTGALLSLCWAKAHGMTLMVQDLTNPMLAIIPHALLAAHAGTIMGVEVNAMQFYPAASEPEETVHPGLYRRRQGQIDISTLSGPGFGYRLSEIERQLPEPDATFGT